MSTFESGSVQSLTGGMEKLFLLSLDLICIAGVDGYFKKINPAFTRVLGYAEKELLETPFIEFIHPDDREQTMQEVESQLQGSTTLHFENRFFHKDGSIRWLSWNAAATNDGLLYAIARDITGQKRNEENLSFEMRELREIVESNSDIFYNYNLEGKLIKWNRAMEELTGLTPQELLLKPALQCICKEDWPCATQAIQEIYEKGSCTVEARFISANGSLVPYLFNGYVIKDDHDTVIGFAGTGRDISKLKKMEGEIRKSEARYRELFENANDLVYTSDLSGMFTSVNKALCEWSGYRAEELVGAHIGKLVSPAHLEKARKMTEAKLKGETSRTRYDIEIIAKNGELITVELNTRLIIENGKPAGVQGIARDVTALRQAETALRESEERFRTLIETADDTIVIMDMDFNRIYENAASWTSLGYTREEWEEQSSFWERIHPGDITLVMEKRVMLLNNGESSTKYRMRHKEGHYLTRLAKSKLVHSDGKPTGIIAILRDITEMERAAEPIRQRELLMTTAQRMAQIGGWEYDAEKQFMAWTDEVYRIHDLSREDISRGSVEHITKSMECYDPADRPVILAAFRRCVEEGVPYDMEFPFTSAKGRRMWIRIAGYPVFGKGKNVGVAGAVGHMMDITARKEIEEQLKAAKEKAEAATLLKDKFVTLVAHDLRSPLATISMMMNAALSNLRGAHYVRAIEMIEKTNGMCETMMEMTVNLLEAAKLQSGDIRLNKKMCNIKNICDAVIGDLHYLAEKKGIALKNEVPDGTRWYVDKILFQRVVHNLMINALKFSRKDGVVTAFLPDQQQTALAVKDTGTGIHESLLPDLFKYEVKTMTTGTSGERGTGFGLPMSMDIIKAHGGTMRAISQEGQGSIFFIETPGTKPTVLVADDDENASFILRKYLENMGAQVLTAKTGAEALEIIHKMAPVLVITDLAMPVMDGLALLQNLKSSGKHSHIPVIIITGNRSIGIRQTAFEHHADDFITKPLSEPDFIPRIGRFIAS